MGKLPSVLGLIAGEGKFPFLVLEEARRLGIRTVTLGVERAADPQLEQAQGEDFHWVGLGELSRSVRIFREANVAEAIMAGRVRHARAFDILRPDRLMLRVLSRIQARTTQAMLETVADVLAGEGIELIDSTSLLREHLAISGPMAGPPPSKKELESIGFGAKMARGLAELDIGQTVVVKENAVVAAEAMEGTDRTIRRAKELATGPFVVVKVARPRQDMRFDVPVVGPGTLDSMSESNATALALESGRVLLLDRDEFLPRAESKGIAVYGVDLA
ncbi:MAG TPA: UDP-2,3-diacylglucosamine diphosphatase LpxI [Vicinamibacteria bacterium]|nr:UDP-2,3-diacylglucosamine diphosphatase LpxI [Vicinamibacteria bacterium]